VKAYISRGLVYYQKGDWERAFADVNKALELDQKSPEALYTKADLLDKAGKGKEAVATYQSFLKYAPPQAKDYIQRAQERIEALRK
jgi:Tfp pilus assembly protein PilF